MMSKGGQTSESFRLSAILSLSGGLQDAYTYNVRGNVFANAQTGNVVLMSQNFIAGDVRTGVKSDRIHWRQVIILIEIVLLGVVGILPTELNMLANILVSLSCAMQVQSFRKVHGYGYASTMCIGNLRSGTESLSQYFRTRDKHDIRRAAHYYGIIFIFAIGAGVGGMLSGILGIYTIWTSVAFLLIDFVMMMRDFLL